MTTVAERDCSSTSAISPKVSPGPSRTMLMTLPELAWRSTSTSPSRKMNMRRPESPSLKVSPSPKI